MRFTDAQLVLMIEKAAKRVNRELCLTGTTNQISVDASGCMTTPPNEPDLEDLLLLATECLLSQRDFSLDLNSSQIGLRVVDGEQALDNRGKGAARQSFFDSPYGPCAEYRKQLEIEKYKRSEGFDIW